MVTVAIEAVNDYNLVNGGKYNGLCAQPDPSRSKITDAVSAAKADCVMLNKDPHIVEAIKLLNQIIENSEVYKDKNAPMLPKLKKISTQK